MRVLMLIAAICVLAWPAAGVTASAPSKPTAHHASPTYLYVSDAAGGTFTAIKGQPGHYRLSLSGVDGKVLYFSDRPYRLVGSEPLGRVLANFFHKPGK